MMRRTLAGQTLAGLAALLLVLTGTYTGHASPPVMSDYTASPPFISSTTTPNILIIMDNSGSMERRACEPQACGVLANGTTSTNINFAATTLYSGYFDSMKCYSWDATDKRFGETTSAKATLDAACPATEWDGNFVNWGTFRRFDAVKKALHGGDCSGTSAYDYNGTRLADGTCVPIGTPSLITIKATVKFVCTNCGHFTTAAVPKGTGVGPDVYAGRVPTGVTNVSPLNSPSSLYIHLRGGDDNMQGAFCVDNDSTAPDGDDSSCTSGDSSAVGPFPIRVVVPQEPRGVIQQIGLNARFGLQLFNSTDGGRLLTAIGARQSINWDSSSVETFNDNTSAMIDSIDESYPKTWTPLGENLYQAVTYIAQIDSNFQSSFGSAYLYSLAYSPAAAYGSSGVGSLGSGTTEQKGITGSETCPTGYLTYACGRDPYFFASNHTPAWASPSAQAVCCKTFVIIMTDGEPTKDQTVPAALQDYAHSQHGMHCTGGSTTIHAPNGTCNTNAATPPATLMGEHKTDYNDTGSHYLDDVALWAHTTDLRPDNGGATPCSGSTPNIAVINLAGHCLPGKQNITLYTFFAFGNIAGRGLLMQAARNGGFDDQNGNNIPDNGLTGGSTAACDMVDLTKPCEYDQLNNVTGEAGRDNVPDSYFESSNVEDLQDRLLSTILSILQQSGSGTAASVLASSTTGEGTAYQAFFYPTTADVSGQVKWTGHLQSLWVDAIGNIREDTDGDGKQIYQNDKIIVTRYDPDSGAVMVDRYADANGDGKADSTTCSPCNGALNEVAPIWEAGTRLALKDASTRKILTWVDSNDNGLVDAGEQIAFSTANSASLSPYVLAEGSGTSPFTANNIINYIRGEKITGLRNRDITVGAAVKVWKLGDIVNSTPVIVGAPKERYDVIYGDSTYTTFFTQYKNRRMVAYFGANDGMLHAMNAGFYHRGDDPTTTTATEHGWFTRTATDNSSGPLLGEELWGFIPKHLLPQLQWLTRGDYVHTYYVDLKPKVTDARIFTADADHPNGWGTILIGGMRLGGSCKDCQSGGGKEIKFKPSGSGQDHFFYSAYFVLDITNPEADPKLLWSLIDDKLQFTTGYPAVLRTSTSTNKTDNTVAKWFAMFGSGPTGYTGASSQEAMLYIVDLKLGPGNNNSNVVRDQSSYSSAFLGDMVSLDANLDYRADVTYFGSVRDTGNPANGTPPKWEGKLFRMTTSNNGGPPFGGSNTPGFWGQSNKPTWFLYDFSCSPSPSCTGPKKPGPIVAAPTVSMDDSQNIWVFVGSGKFWDMTDKANTETQYFFGMKDDTINGGCTQGSDFDCIQKDLVNVSSTVVCSTCAGGTNQVTDSNNTGVTTLTGTTTSSLQGLVASKEGWYTTLPTSGERALYTPTLFGGIVFFPTFVPSVGSVCVGGTGNSYLYALFYLTGSAYKASVVGVDIAGGNTNVKRSTALGAGIASQVAIHIGGEGSDAGSGVTSREKLCSQMSTGELVCRQGNPPIDTWSRYLSWINLRL